MISSMLRVYGKKFDVLRFLKDSGWKVKKHWLKGEKRNSKLLNKDFGFNFEILYSNRYSIDGYKKHIEEIVRFLKKNENNIKKIWKLGAEKIWVDIGIIDDTKFSISPCFKGEILKIAYKQKLLLGVSFYPSKFRVKSNSQIVLNKSA